MATFGKSHVVTASKDRTVRIIDVSTNQQVGALEHREGLAHASTIYDLNTLGSNVVVSGSRDGYVKIWDCRTLRCTKNLDASDGFVYGVNFSTDGRVIAGTSGKTSRSEGKKEKSKKLKDNAHVVIWDFRSI